jgi:MSHA biogenesis protein MshJ
MDVLKQRWQVWSMRLDAMSFRERILVFLAVAGVALSLVFVGLIEPALKRQEQMLTIASGLQEEVFTLREQLTRSEQQTQSGLSSELARLRAEAEALERQVKTRESGLIPPDRMIAAIKTLLTAQPGLTLVALQTVPPRPALGEAAAATDAAGAPVPPAESFYKHGVILRVHGSYAQLADYVAHLESLPWTVQWESVRVDARKHPQLELTLKLNTLSREATWARL